MKRSKNIVFAGISIDGFIAGVNGELDWLEIIPNPDGEDMCYGAFIDEVDALVMGRSTYEVVKNFDIEWPYQKHVFVLSNQLKEIPPQHIGKITILKGSPIEILNQIHSKGFKTLYIDGGVTVQKFLEEDLIDELRLTRLPILLGDGISLFKPSTQRLVFDLVETKTFLNQLVFSHYIRKRE